MLVVKQWIIKQSNEHRLATDIRDHNSIDAFSQLKSSLFLTLSSFKKKNTSPCASLHRVHTFFHFSFLRSANVTARLA